VSYPTPITLVASPGCNEPPASPDVHDRRGINLTTLREGVK
jgi:hypothetical protein